MIGRRQLLSLAAGVMAAHSTTLAQTSARRPRVAVLDWSVPPSERSTAFLNALADLGHIDGKSIVADVRFAEGQPGRADALAAKIVAAKPDVIVTFATPAGAAAKRATTTIPIIAATADPVGAGLVTSTARPVGNVTGISSMLTDVGAKHVELLRDLLPSLKEIAFIGSKPDPATSRFIENARDAADRSGIRLVPHMLAGSGELDAAFADVARKSIKAAVVQPLFALNRAAAKRTADIALRHRVPSVSSFAHFARAGGFAAYGPDPNFGAKAAAKYVDLILRGAKVSDLPVEQPTRFELVVNLKTAKALGLTIPHSLLIRADEVIE